jgi:hypothetical protein
VEVKMVQNGINLTADGPTLIVTTAGAGLFIFGLELKNRALLHLKLHTND